MTKYINFPFFTRFVNTKCIQLIVNVEMFTLFHIENFKTGTIQ